jgi:hypothetical protein
MTEFELAREGGTRWGVSERDTGVKKMQDWKFGVEGKASVCMGIWRKWIGKRPALMGSKNVASSEERWVIRDCSEESWIDPTRKHFIPACQKPHGRREFTQSNLRPLFSLGQSKRKN